MKNDKSQMTDAVKKMAREMGAEMVGVASMDRFTNAPVIHSPQGLSKLVELPVEIYLLLK